MTRSRAALHANKRRRKGDAPPADTPRQDRLAAARYPLALWAEYRTSQLMAGGEMGFFSGFADSTRRSRRYAFRTRVVGCSGMSSHRAKQFSSPSLVYQRTLSE